MLASLNFSISTRMASFSASTRALSAASALAFASASAFLFASAASFSTLALST